jgi:hypothetical protein
MTIDARPEDYILSHAGAALRGGGTALGTLFWEQHSRLKGQPWKLCNYMEKLS